MSRKRTVLGYPSVQAACVALSAQNMPIGVIAQKVGCSVANVRTHLWTARRAAGDTSDRRKNRFGVKHKTPDAAPPEPRPVLKRKPGPKTPDTRGIWTIEKITKARRLFGKTMLMIADALEVPPMELMDYGLKGVIPPIGKGQRIAQLLVDLSEDAAPPAVETPPLDATLQLAPPATIVEQWNSGAVPAPPLFYDQAELQRRQTAQAAIDAELEADEQLIHDEAERERDEAELAALAEEEDDDGETADELSADTGGADRNGGDGLAIAAATAAGPIGDGERTIEPAAEAEAEAPAAAAAEPEGPPRKYRLTDGAGRYLLADPARGLTLNRALAWSGTAKDMEGLFKVAPQHKQLDPERVPG